MARTLLLAEHDNAMLDPQTASALTAALSLGSEVDILVVGSSCAAAAAAASVLAGVSRVLVAERVGLAHRPAEAVSALIVALAPDYDAIVAAATSTGKDILPRAAALLDVMQVSDITEILGPDTFRRPTYAGNAIETVQASDATRVITVRASAFAPARSASSVPIQAVQVPATAILTRFIAQTSREKTSRPELTSAKVVVSGGRAFGSKEKFDELLIPLAQKLNAAIGASRAAVDAGYAPNDLQVGQTGKVVAPDLYIACGISGAIQHLAGMKESKVIVAINTDATAPIFQVADYGVVGDLFAILPELTAALSSSS